jgi:hypothetical protein
VIGSIRLLKPQDEIALVRRIHAGKVAAQASNKGLPIYAEASRPCVIDERESKCYCRKA